MTKLKFMPFQMAGYPSIAESVERIKILDKYADMFEIGIPFSDPSADGEVIKRAGEIAIKNGFKTKDVFGILEQVNTKKPVGLLCYLNTVMQYGIENFMKDAGKYGIKTVLCPDLPPEHRDLLAIDAKKYNIDIIHIISTNTPTERAKYIDNMLNSFIYMVSKPSITGAQDIILDKTIEYINEIKEFVKNPVYIGFGVSNRLQIEQLKKTKIDGFIIGAKITSLQTNEIEPYLIDLLS